MSTTTQSKTREIKVQVQYKPKVGFLVFDRDRSQQSGSARIRAANLIKYAPNYEMFQTGIKYDVVIFQKYYWHDYAKLYKGLKILDICDPDWLQGSPNMELVRLLEHMDGVVANTEATADYMRKLTSKPIVVIPDRHDMALMRERKIHKGRAKRVLWFGYSHNAHVLKLYIPKLMELGLHLTIISEKFVSPSGHTHSEFKQFEHWVKWPGSIEAVNKEMLKCDFALLPASRKPQDQYKSNNKTTHAWSIGLPVAHWGDDIDRLMEEQARKAEAELHYNLTHIDYDCKNSVNELDRFIEQLKK